jgi:8-oxo-dGTP diphosphatase
MIGVFADPGRDPRGRTISFAHATAVRGPVPAVRGGDDAAKAAWLDPFNPPALAFDHGAILTTALEWLKREVAEGPRAIGLLAPKFGDAEIKALHRALGLPARDAIAWRARMRREGKIAPVASRKGRFQAISD